MLIGSFVARTLRAEGFEVKASDRVSYVNWVLQEAGSVFYVGLCENLKDFAVFERDY
jgi:nucleoside-diphosphate-sugar epimerase